MYLSSPFICCHSGLNSVINSIPLESGDEIICLSLTYGSTKKIMSNACARSGATLKVVEIALPIRSPESVISLFKKELTNRTKLVVLDQITSNTAMILPIADMSLLSRDVGAIVIIDAAHALFSQDCSIYSPDQEVLSDDIILPSDHNSKSDTIDNRSNHGDNHHHTYNKKYVCIADFADVWITNAHKWMSNPKGCAFMWISPIMALRLRPAIISHGYVPNNQNCLNKGREEEEKYFDRNHETSSTTELINEVQHNKSSSFINSKYSGHYIAPDKLLSSYSWDGCRDYSALLTMPSAISLWGRLSNHINTSNNFHNRSNKIIHDSIGNHSLSLNTSKNDINSIHRRGDVKKKPKCDLSLFRNYNKKILDEANQLLSTEWGVSDDDFAAPKGMRENSPMSLVSTIITQYTIFSN